MAIPTIHIKRAYAPASSKDGWRILVDRLWPRGVKNETADYKDWFKVIAPSIELRKAFGHKEENWPEFRKNYKKELKDNKAALEELLEVVKKHPTVTLVYGARDPDHNNAVVLREVLLTLLKKP